MHKLPKIQDTRQGTAQHRAHLSGEDSQVGRTKATTKNLDIAGESEGQVRECEHFYGKKEVQSWNSTNEVDTN